MVSFYDFIREHPPIIRIQINELLLAEYQCPLQQSKFDIYSHLNYFMYVLNGKKKWHTSQQSVTVNAGECIFVRKGACTVEQYFDKDFCAVVLFMPDEFIREVLLEHQVPLGSTNKWQMSTDYSIFALTKSNSLTAYFQSLLSYLTEDTKPGHKLLEIKYKELLLVASSHTCNHHLVAYLAVLCQNSKPGIKEIMDNNFNYPMRLEEYARLSARSLSAFKRDFKEFYNTSPGRWLKNKRLELAKHLLLHTNKSVTEVAFESGFVNHSHFTRAFKEVYGTTPVDCAKSQPS